MLTMIGLNTYNHNDNQIVDLDWSVPQQKYNEVDFKIDSHKILIDKYLGKHNPRITQPNTKNKVSDWYL